MEELHILERTLVDMIVAFHANRYECLKLQLPFLYVDSRQFTGVGVYVYFKISETDLKNIDVDETIDTALGIPKLIKLEKLYYELSFELDIKDGIINYLEIVKNGDEVWDGIYGKYSVVDW